MAKAELTKEASAAVKAAAAKRGVSMSSLVNKILVATLEKDTQPVILSIPKKLTRGHAEEMRAWLSSQSDVIFKQFYKS